MIFKNKRGLRQNNILVSTIEAIFKRILFEETFHMDFIFSGFKISFLTLIIKLIIIIINTLFIV